MTIQIPKTENAFVAFLDVLGFSELVKAENNNDLENFFSVTLENFKTITVYKGEIRKLILSDSIILVVDSENKNDNFLKLLRAIRDLQASLALKGIWIRGAVSYGDVYLNGKNEEE